MNTTKFFKFLLILAVFLFFIVCSLSINLSQANADDAIPDGGRVPCQDVGANNIEFNSDRPYQASPCGDSPKALFCGNRLVIIEGVSRPNTNTVPPGTVIPVTIPVNKTYTISIKDMQLPILGNTEKIKNNIRSDAELDEATRMNEYLSSYLKGINKEAEYDQTDQNNVVDFSGPIQKLLPQALQEAQRINIIATIIAPSKFIDDITGKDVKDVSNHNQIVVCAQGGKPINCYKGDGSSARGTVYRLNDWKGELSIVNTILDSVGVEAWNLKIPPLPWQFEKDILYQKAYNEWRGKQCVILPGIEKLVCVDVPLVTSNEWADLFPYIPLANTTDKSAKLAVPSGKAEIQPAGATEIDPKKESLILSEPAIFFAHTQENADLSEILNKTFVPQEGTDNKVPSESTENNSSVCKVVDVRSNDGDNLFAGVKPDEYVFSVSFTFKGLVCGQIQESPNCHRSEDGKTKICDGIERSQTCDGEVSITLPTITKTPYADEIWQTTTGGNSSAFRKLFPKVEDGAPVACIADIPAVTNATYTLDSVVGGGESKTGNLTVVGPDESRSDGSPAHVYFPHLGSVYDYFLKGIQTALRPQGYGEPLANAGICITAPGCGKMPELKSSSCALKGGDKPNPNWNIPALPPTMISILEAAGEKYNVPPALLVAVMFGEGRFNGGIDWSEENVQSWSMGCSIMPSCSPAGSGGQGPYNMEIPTWEQYKNAVKVVDPGRTPNRCNFMDQTFAMANKLGNETAGTSYPAPGSCMGVRFNTGSKTGRSCSDWSQSDVATAIRQHEGSCYSTVGTGALGSSVGGCAADNCEKFNQCFPGGTDNFSCSSHTYYLWSVYKSYK